MDADNGTTMQGYLAAVTHRANDETERLEEGAQVRYRIDDETQIIEVLDAATLKYVEGATGHALFDQADSLLAEWSLIAGPQPGQFQLPAGWGFPARQIVLPGGQPAHAGTAGGGNGDTRH